MTFTVDEVFKVLNLGIRIWLIAYVIKRYVVDQVTQKIKEEGFEITSLRQQYTMWREKSADVSKKMQEEQQVFFTMQDKFVAWQRDIDLKKAKKRAECVLRQKKIEDCVARKYESIWHRQLVQTELPEIVDHTAVVLQKKFKEDSALGRKYISDVLDGLQG